MGLIGSNFLSHLVTPPRLWTDQELPVYVIPDHIQLSDVHNVRLQELGLAIGIPFQITQTNPYERPTAKVMESEAVRSIVTIVEDTVELREVATPVVQVDSTSGSSGGLKLALCFQYSAMDDFELKIDLYVRLSSSTQKIRFVFFRFFTTI